MFYEGGRIFFTTEHKDERTKKAVDELTNFIINTLKDENKH